jgi:DNA-binding LacI/PurR family transcriptional regulator
LGSGLERLRTGAVRQIGLISSMPFAIAGGPSRLGFFMEVASSAAETALTSGYVQMHADHCARLLLEHLAEQGTRNVVLVAGAQPRESRRSRRRPGRHPLRRDPGAHERAAAHRR